MDAFCSKDNPVSVPAKRMVPKRKQHGLGHYQEYSFCDPWGCNLLSVLREEIGRSDIWPDVAVYFVVIPVLYPGCSFCRACSDAWNAHASKDNLLHLDDHSFFEESKD